MKRLSPERVTSPLVYARVVRLEEEANASPNNVAKQVTLWRAILDLETPSAYERIISRWERLLEFVRPDHSYLDTKFNFHRHPTVKCSNQMQPSGFI